MEKLINDNKAGDTGVTAIIKVKVAPVAMYGYKGIARIIAKEPEAESIYLMSGEYDIAVIANCANLGELGRFVDERLSTIEGVLGISSHLIIGRYKQSGETGSFADDERGFVSP